MNDVQGQQVIDELKTLNKRLKTIAIRLLVLGILVVFGFFGSQPYR
jgi:hypothetical protein